jgi:hypothetical protein
MASIDAAHAEAFTTPGLVFAGVAVGACSSVIPYVCDQLAMSRLPRASFVLPATATLIGVMVLAQIPSGQDMIGVLLVMFGVAPQADGAGNTYSGHGINGAVKRLMRAPITASPGSSERWRGIRERYRALSGTMAPPDTIRTYDLCLRRARLCGLIWQTTSGWRASGPIVSSVSLDWSTVFDTDAFDRGSAGAVFAFSRAG